jgi:hypothetical protein
VDRRCAYDAAQVNVGSTNLCFRLTASATLTLAALSEFFHFGGGDVEHNLATAGIRVADD